MVFHYPNNVDVTFSSTQFAKGWWDVTERFFGTKAHHSLPTLDRWASGAMNRGNTALRQNLPVTRKLFP